MQIQFSTAMVGVLVAAAAYIYLGAGSVFIAWRLLDYSFGLMILATVLAFFSGPSGSRNKSPGVGVCFSILSAFVFVWTLMGTIFADWALATEMYLLLGTAVLIVPIHVFCRPGAMLPLLSVAAMSFVVMVLAVRFVTADAMAREISRVEASDGCALAFDHPMDLRRKQNVTGIRRITRIGQISFGLMVSAESERIAFAADGKVLVWSYAQMRPVEPNISAGFARQMIGACATDPG